jgi:hypothetical protein
MRGPFKQTARALQFAVYPEFLKVTSSIIAGGSHGCSSRFEGVGSARVWYRREIDFEHVNLCFTVLNIRMAVEGPLTSFTGS